MCYENYSKHWLNTKNFLQAGLVMVLCMCLSTCLIHRTSIEMNDENIGIITLSYSLTEEFLSFAQYDNNEQHLSLPISKYEFNRLSALSPGLELRKYNQKQRDGMTHVTAELSFESPEALSHVFDGGYRFNSDPWKMTIPLVVGLADLSDAERNLLRNEASEIAFHFSFSLTDTRHRFIGSEPNTIIIQDNQLEFSYTLLEMLEFQDQAFIEFTQN